MSNHSAIWTHKIQLATELRDVLSCQFEYRDPMLVRLIFYDQTSRNKLFYVNYTSRNQTLIAAVHAAGLLAKVTRVTELL